MNAPNTIIFVPKLYYRHWLIDICTAKCKFRCCKTENGCCQPLKQISSSRVLPDEILSAVEIGFDQFQNFRLIAADILTEGAVIEFLQ